MSACDLFLPDGAVVISVITRHHSKLRTPQTTLPGLFPNCWCGFNNPLHFFLFFLNHLFVNEQECRDLKTAGLLEGEGADG